jgi:HEAT repeat protein
MRHVKILVVVSSFALAGCVTETRNLNGELLEKKKPSNTPTPVEQVEAQVRKRIDHLKYESGAELLRSMETIAGCEQLALKPIAEALPNSDAGVRANLVYTLSLIGGSQAHSIVARQVSDQSPIVRYEAASALLQFKDVSGIPILIGFLEDEDRRLRFKSIQALEGFTNEDFGYDFGAPEPVRAESVKRWKDWWTMRRTELVYQP